MEFPTTRLLSGPFSKPCRTPTLGCVVSATTESTSSYKVSGFKFPFAVRATEHRFFAGTSVFLPQIIAGLGKFTVVQTNLRSVGPYMVAAVWSVFISYGAWRYRIHGFLIAGSCVLSVIGYAIFLSTAVSTLPFLRRLGLTDSCSRSQDPKILYGAAFLTFSGALPNGPLFLSLATANAGTPTERAIAAAIIPSFGSFGSIASTWLYLPQFKPRYIPVSLAIFFPCRHLFILMGSIYYRETSSTSARRFSQWWSELVSLSTGSTRTVNEMLVSGMIVSKARRKRRSRRSDTVTLVTDCSFRGKIENRLGRFSLVYVPLTVPSLVVVRCSSLYIRDHETKAVSFQLPSSLSSERQFHFSQFLLYTAGISELVPPPEHTSMSLSVP